MLHGARKLHHDNDKGLFELPFEELDLALLCLAISGTLESHQFCTLGKCDSTEKCDILLIWIHTILNKFHVIYHLRLILIAVLLNKYVAY